MTCLVCYNIYANCDTQELKLQGLRVQKSLFYDFKVAIIFFNIVSLRLPQIKTTHMLLHNVYANSDTQKLKLQGLREPKTLFYDFKVIITL